MVTLVDLSTTCAQVIIILTLMMTFAQVVETSVNVTTNSLSKDYIHLDYHTSLTYCSLKQPFVFCQYYKFFFWGGGG